MSGPSLIMKTADNDPGGSDSKSNSVQQASGRIRSEQPGGQKMLKGSGGDRTGKGEKESKWVRQRKKMKRKD